jgi:CheY-specific phosphatase CheX
MGLSTDEILDHVKDAVEDVFTTMLDTVAVLVEQGGCKHDNAAKVEDDFLEVDIEALVEFHGAIAGSVILRASTRGAADITRKLLMMEADETADLEDIKDAMGECANMVTGALKTRAFDPSGNFTLTVPVVNSKVRVEHQYPAGALTYKLSDGDVAVEVWLSEAVQ